MKNILTLSVLFALFIGFSLNSSAITITDDNSTVIMSDDYTSNDVLDNDKDKDKDKKGKKSSKENTQEVKEVKSETKTAPTSVKHHPKKSCGGCKKKAACNGGGH